MAPYISPYTKDLLAQRSRIQDEISALQRSITDRNNILVFLDTMIKQAEARDQEWSKENHTVIPREKNISTEEGPSISSNLLSYLSERINRSARTSDFTDTFAKNNREEAQKIHNALSLLSKQGKIQVVKEYDTLGVERKRNRLYQLFIK